MADPVDDQDAATKKYVDDHIHSGAVSKKYVDDENARQDIAINSKAGKDEVALLRAKDNIFMNNFKIFNLPNPSGPQQPATKAYVDGKNAQQDIAINSKAERDEVLLLDGSKSMMGNLQMGKKKITDLGDGSDDGDAVNFSQLLSHTDNHQVNYHLQPSFTFYKNQTIINSINIPNVIPNHNHLDLYIVSKVSSNNGFGGQAWVSLRMTNTLKAGLYTVVFETFAALFGFSTLNDETLITQVFGDAHFKIITFNHDWESDSGGNTPHSKAYIQFSSDGQSGEITFEIRYYGSSYNQNITFLFFSRVISGRQNNNFNHALFNVNSVQYQNQIMYFEDINLNQNRIIKLQDPIDDNDAATKGYVDGKVVNVDLTGYLRRDGSLNMTGNLKMDKKYIEDLETPNDVPITDLANYRKDAYRAANKEYLRQNFLKRDENGGDDYDLKQKVIRNLFKEDDNDITKVGKVEKDFYDINQATYEFTIDYDSKIGYYSTRLTIDLKALDIGEFTLVFEMYYDKSKIDKDEVVVDALSGSLTVSRHNTNKFSDHSRTIINFHKYGFLGFNDLDIDITLKNKSGVSYDPTATIFVVVYGVLGHQNDVDTRIWDRIYYVDNQNVKFEAAIDMNDHDAINVDNLSMNNFINMNDNQVKNLQDGNENGDAVNVKQLNAAVNGVYFNTRNPVYSQTALNIIQTMKWNSISNYQWSGSNDFTLNSDSITIKQSGLYLRY